MPSLLTRGEYQLACEEAGFDNITFQDWTLFAAPSVARMLHLVRPFVPVTRWLAKAGRYDPDRAAHNVACKVAAETLSDGLWRYVAMRATKA